MGDNRASKNNGGASSGAPHNGQAELQNAGQLLRDQYEPQVLSNFMDAMEAQAPQMQMLFEEITSSIKAYFPQSDAKVGPLSRLTYSGRALIRTFTSGMRQEAPSLGKAAEEAMGLVAPDVQAGGGQMALQMDKANLSVGDKNQGVAVGVDSAVGGESKASRKVIRIAAPDLAAGIEKLKFQLITLAQGAGGSTEGENVGYE